MSEPRSEAHRRAPHTPPADVGMVDDAAAERKKQLLAKLAELKEKNLKYHHDVEVGAQKIKELKTSMVGGLAETEKREEHLTNVMHRKLQKLDNERAKLAQHLEKEEAYKMKLEKRLLTMNAENKKLKEHLLAEEKSIVTRLEKPLHSLQKQRAELERKIAEEAELDSYLRAQMELYKSSQLGGTPSGAPQLGGNVALGSSALAETSTNLELTETMDAASESVGGLPHHVRRGSTISLNTGVTNSAAATPCESERKSARPVLTSQSLKQLESIGAVGSSETAHSMSAGLYQDSQSTPRRESHTTLSQGPAFSPMPSLGVLPNLLAPIPAPSVSASGIDGVAVSEFGDETASGVDGRPVRAGSVYSMASSLADDLSMAAQLKREIVRLKRLQEKSSKQSATYESSIHDLEKKIEEARALQHAELGELNEVSDRLARTNSIANELSTQNEHLEWSTSRCSVASSSFAAGTGTLHSFGMRDSEAGTPTTTSMSMASPPAAARAPSEMSVPRAPLAPRPVKAMYRDPQSGEPMILSDNTPTNSALRVSAASDTSSVTPMRSSSVGAGPFIASPGSADGEKTPLNQQSFVDTQSQSESESVT